MNDKRALYATVIIAIILMLLLVRRNSSITNIIQPADSNLSIETPSIHYDIPALVLNKNPVWDWMQTTSLSCGCDAGLWKQPIEFDPVPTVLSFPVYNYIITPQYQVGPTPSLPFAVYTPPPLPTWWYEWGFNIKGEGPNAYIMTSLGTTLIGGKYSRAADQYGNYSDQTKYDWTQTGPDIYYGGKHYVHDANKDYPHPKPVKAPSYGGAMSWA